MSLFNSYLGFREFPAELYSVIVECSHSFDPRPDDIKYVVKPRGATLATKISCEVKQ